MEFSIRNLFNKDKNGSPLNPTSGENGLSVPSNGAQLSSLDLNQVPQNGGAAPVDTQTIPAVLSPSDAPAQQPPPLSALSPFTPQQQAPPSPFAPVEQSTQPDAIQSPFSAAPSPPSFAPAESNPQPQPSSPFTAAPTETSSPASPPPLANETVHHEPYTPPTSPFATAEANTAPPSEASPFAAAQDIPPQTSPFQPPVPPPTYQTQPSSPLAPESPAVPSATVADSPFASASPFSPAPSSQPAPPPGVPPFEPAPAEAEHPPATQVAETEPSPFGAITAVVDHPAQDLAVPPPIERDETTVFATAPEDNGSVELPLQEILHSYSIEQLGFDSSKVPAHVTTKLALAIVKPQLSSGNITLPLTTIVDGCDERFHRAFAQAAPNLEIRIPIQRIFRYLPAGCMAPNHGAAPQTPPAPEPPSTPLVTSADANPFAPSQEFETPFSTKASEDEQAGLSAPPVSSLEPPAMPFEAATVPTLFGGSEPVPENTASPFSQPPVQEPAPAPPALETQTPPESSPFGVPVVKQAEALEPTSPPPAPLGPPEEVRQETPDAAPSPFQEIDLSTQNVAPVPEVMTPEPFIPVLDSPLPTNTEPPPAPITSPWATDIPTPEPIESPTDPTPSPFASSLPEISENPWGTPAEQISAPDNSVPEQLLQPLKPVTNDSDDVAGEPAAATLETSDETLPSPLLQPAGFTSLKPLTPLPKANANFGLKVPTSGMGDAIAGDELTSDDLLEDLEDLPAYGTTSVASDLDQEVEEDFTFGFQDDDPILLTLRAVFETDEQIDLEKAVELSGLLPGIAAAVFLDGSQAVSSHSMDDLSEPFATKAPEVYQSVRGLATAMGMGDDASTFTIRTNSGIMSFFKEGEACLGVLHQNNGFLPGIREKLTLVTRGLAGMALPS